MKTIAIIAIILVIVLIAGFVSLRRKKGPTPTTTVPPQTTTAITPQTTITPATISTPTEGLSMQDAFDDFGDLTDGILDIPTDTEVIVGDLESESFELTL